MIKDYEDKKIFGCQFYGKRINLNSTTFLCVMRRRLEIEY